MAHAEPLGDGSTTDVPGASAFMPEGDSEGPAGSRPPARSACTELAKAAAVASRQR
jgi:hypothetical protein